MPNWKTFTKIARIEDLATNKVVERIEFPKAKGIGQIELAPSLVHDPRNFERQLRDAGAILPRDKKAKRALLERLANERPAKSFTYAARCGWTEGTRSYVLPGEAIGSPADGVIGINPSVSEGHGSGTRSEQGTWRGWRERVARPARSSSLLMTAISFSLAAPMLSLLKRDSRTIVLFGPSRSGKTTVTLIAASAIGIGSTSELPTWNITDARLEQQLALFNNSLFPIDDLAILGGKGRDAYRRVHDLAYRLHQGWGRARHSSFAGGNGQNRERWRTIGITSSETSVLELAQMAGCQRQAGECVRLIDVPVLVDGQDNLFDRARSTMSRRESAELLERITEEVANHHGAAFRRHLLNVIRYRAGIKKFLKKKIRHFTNVVLNEDDGNLARDVAETFGLAYAAGSFAIERDLVPWDEQDLLKAIGRVYRGARELLPDPGVALRTGHKALRLFLREIRRSAQLGRHEIDLKKARGICKVTRAERRYLIRHEAFNSIFGSTHQKELVVDRLLKKGRLTPAKSRRRAGLVGSKLREQFTWPDGERRRSVEIRVPRKKTRARKTDKK